MSTLENWLHGLIVEPFLMSKKLSHDYMNVKRADLYVLAWRAGWAARGDQCKCGLELLSDNPLETITKDT